MSYARTWGPDKVRLAKRFGEDCVQLGPINLSSEDVNTLTGGTAIIGTEIRRGISTPKSDVLAMSLQALIDPLSSRESSVTEDPYSDYKGEAPEEPEDKQKRLNVRKIEIPLSKITEENFPKMIKAVVDSRALTDRLILVHDTTAQAANR